MICCLTAAGLCCCAARLRRRKRLALALLAAALGLTAYHYRPRDPFADPPICHEALAMTPAHRPPASA